MAEKQAAAQSAAKQLETAKNNLTKAKTESAELTKRIKTLGELMKTGAAKIVTAKAAADKSTKELAVEKDRVEKLVAEYKRLKSGAPEPTKEAKK